LYVIAASSLDPLEVPNLQSGRLSRELIPQVVEELKSISSIQKLSMLMSSMAS